MPTECPQSIHTDRPPTAALLCTYKIQFVANGLKLPLAPVPSPPNGLLAQLPPPPSGKHGWPWTVETPPHTAKTSALTPPRITIVTPSYQQGAYLEATIRSVLLQNYPNLEYIIFDGGSTDESPSIIEKYRPWLSFAQSATDRGQGNAINLGFSLSSGSLHGWINSDDLYMPNALQSLARHSHHHPTANFFYGDGITLDDATGQLTPAPAPLVHRRYLHFGGLIFSHAAFWRSAIHQPIWETMKCNIDGELWLRLIPGQKLHYIPQPLGLVRLQPNAKTIHPRHRAAWEADDQNIWAIHGRPPKPRSLLRYEYRYIHHFITRHRLRKNYTSYQAIINQCQWPALPAKSA